MKFDLLNKHKYTTITFVKTLVIKCSATAYNLQKINDLPLDVDKSEWIYYKHLNGLYHNIDEPVLVNHFELPPDTVLDKQLLIDNEWLRSLLIGRGSFYTDLVSKFPKMVIYINNVINDKTYDIDEIVNLPDGSILNYNDIYLDVKEDSLVQDLEKFTIWHYERWFLKNFMLIDKEYLAGYLYGFYQNIVLKVIGLRLERIGTYEVHDYHIFTKLNNKFYLGSAGMVMPADFRMWLYNNIDYLTENIGINKSLDLLLYNIEKYTQIYVRHINMISTHTKYEETDMFTPNYNASNRVLVACDLEDKPANKLNLDVHVNSEKNLTEKNSSHDTMAYREKFSLPLYQTIHHTKDLKLDYDRTLDTSMFANFKLMLIVLIETYDNNSLDRVRFTEPKTNNTYDITYKDALVMLIYLLTYEFGEENITVDSIKYNFITNLSDSEYDRRFLDEDDEEYVLPFVRTLIPNTNQETKALFLDMMLFKENIAILNTNMYNTFYAGMVEKLLMMSNKTKIKHVTFGNINSYLESREILLDVSSSDTIYYSIGAITEAITGVNITRYLDMRDLLNSIEEIINSLSSYTTQVINDGYPESLDMFYNEISLFSGLEVGCVDETTLHCLEPNDSDIHISADDKLDDVIVTYTYNAQMIKEIAD